eukprot:1128069-Pelagomonas_calceolata.AAC.5
MKDRVTHAAGKTVQPHAMRCWSEAADAQGSSGEHQSNAAVQSNQFVLEHLDQMHHLCCWAHIQIRTQTPPRTAVKEGLQVVLGAILPTFSCTVHSAEAPTQTIMRD